MYKLLKAGFFRVKKDIIFWLFIFLTIGIALFNLFRHNPNDHILDQFVNEYIMYIGLFISIFVSIFVGKEQSEGIIRNKIIVGHKRGNIYLSNLIISIVTSIFCELIYLAIILLIGIPLFGQLQMPLNEFIMSILNVFLIIIAYCSIFNFVTMLCSEITISTTVCIILFIAMFILSSSLSLTANSPKYITHSYWENDVEYIISKEPNPNYPGEQKVKIAKIMYLFIPQGQASDIASGETKYFTEMPLYSITLISIINICGVYLFKKKELK